LDIWLCFGDFWVPEFENHVFNCEVIKLKRHICELIFVN